MKSYQIKKYLVKEFKLSSEYCKIPYQILCEKGYYCIDFNIT